MSLLSTRTNRYAKPPKQGALGAPSSVKATEFNKIVALHTQSAVCCRCMKNLDGNRAFGGSFDGVVCTLHRSCQDCWFGADDTEGDLQDGEIAITSVDYGLRAHEPDETRYRGLVSKPRSGTPRCFGCIYQIKIHPAALPPMVRAEDLQSESSSEGSDSDNDVVMIEID